MGEEETGEPHEILLFPSLKLPSPFATLSYSRPMLREVSSEAINVTGYHQQCCRTSISMEAPLLAL
jgi:hypothetical protein